MSAQPQTSRRLFLAAGSASAVFGALAQAAARVSSDADPIIKALAGVRAARAAYEQEPDDTADDAFDRIGEFEAELFSTEPTTIVGATALLAYMADFLDQDGVVNDSLGGDLIGDSIRAALDVFEREARS
ncbi:MAG: hypothetical protein FJX06_21275 [Alphaproteobacteria bacterium]|nr:hypothetical protein [Alphaproteobacteria bacterium]